MAEDSTSNPKSEMEKAEGSRETVDATLRSEERRGGRDRAADQQDAGITNRPLEEEIENQRELPPRGESRRPDEDQS